MSLLDRIGTQWRGLMEKGAWSEDFVFTLDASYTVDDFTVSGVFFSGTSSEESPAQAYSPKKAVRKEALQISEASLPSSVHDPRRMLKGAVAVSATRGAYKVLDVRGERSGTLTLTLNPKEA